MTTPHQRDHGLGRVSRLTRWVVVVAAAATGVFGFVLARPAPTSANSSSADDGSTSVANDSPAASGSKASNATTSTIRSGSASAATGQSRSTVPLRPPVQTPQPTKRAARARSGGS
ncbi:MAG: hypothetical protein WCK41_01830 [Actinomycetes bacterium]